MKMPHVDDHIIRSSHTPPPHRQQRHHEGGPPRHHQPYYNDKRPSDPEMSPHVHRHEAHSPHNWGRPHHHHLPYQPSMDESSRSAFHENATPPPSPHVPPRYDYSSYDSYHHGSPSVPPYRRRGGYSYYHHHPNSQPPMMPRDMHPYAPPSHYRHGADMMSPPPPTYSGSYPPHLPTPRYETPPLTSGSATSYYHDQQYPHFLPPSASMSTTASSRSGASAASLTPREEEEYGYDSVQAVNSQEEVNQVGPNDVLCGRGAPTNYHPGNEYFRELVKQYQNTYLASKRADKPFVASHIVNIVQSRGGRFLRRYKRNGVSWERGHFVWVEVDPQKAYEKACQALREGAPEIRRKIKEETENSGGEDDRTSPSKEASSGERIEDAGAKASPEEDSKGAEPTETTEAEELSEDTRNDEMQDSERS